MASIISDWMDGTIEKSNNYTIKFIGNVVIVMLVSIILFALFGINYIWITVLLVGIISGLLVMNLNVLEGNATFKLILNTGLFTYFCFLIAGLIFILMGLSNLNADDYGLFSGFVSQMADLMYYFFAGFFVETGFVAAVIAIVVKYIKASYSGSLNVQETSAPKVISSGNFGTCSHCGAVIEEEDQEFCTDCGKPLNKDTEEKTDKKNYCDVCGRPVEEGDKMCPNCGNPL